MTDFLSRVTATRSHIEPRWSAERERQVRLQVELSRERKRWNLRALSFAALAAVLVLGFGLRSEWFSSERSALALREPTRTLLLELPDGTRAGAVNETARLRPLLMSNAEVAVELEAGAAHFEVARREGRRFQVRARDVVVTVLGTEFTVDLLPSAVRVEVQHGRVDVRWPSGHRVLSGGEQLVASSSPAESAALTSASPGMPEPPLGDELPVTRPDEAIADDLEFLPASPAPAPATRAPLSQPTWRDLAQEGDYAGAFAKIGEQPNSVRNEPGDLLFAADVARLSGHPALAVPRLEQVLRAHSADSRAPLAAFTLGRTLLDALGRPREAAEAFARVRKLSPKGALSQDALAREVESWSRAGEANLARERAVEYLRRFPGGRREKAVRHHGGLQAAETER